MAYQGIYHENSGHTSVRNNTVGQDGVVTVPAIPAHDHGITINTANPNENGAR